MVHGKQRSTDLKQELFALLRQTIRPEFLNRVDEVIIFKPLGHADIRKIVDVTAHAWSRPCSRSRVCSWR